MRPRLEIVPALGDDGPMSHTPVECRHCYTSWTTEERVNAAGDRCFAFAHRCTLCGHVEETSAAIEEPHEPFMYAKLFEGGEEADD